MGIVTIIWDNMKNSGIAIAEDFCSCYYIRYDIVISRWDKFSCKRISS